MLRLVILLCATRAAQTADTAEATCLHETGLCVVVGGGGGGVVDGVCGTVRRDTARLIWAATLGDPCLKRGCHPGESVFKKGLPPWGIRV